MYIYDKNLSKEQNEAKEAEFIRVKNKKEESNSSLIKGTTFLGMAFVFFRVGHRVSEEFKAIRFITIPIGIFLLLAGLLLVALKDR